MTSAELSNVIHELVQIESPIHIEEAQRVIASFYATRASKRTRESFQEGLNLAVRKHLVQTRGPFLWSPEQKTVVVRLRDDICPVTQPELIAPEEFQAAVRLVLENQFGLQRDALIVSTSRLLGFRRCGTNLEAAISTAIHTLLQQRQIECDSQGFLKLRLSGKLP